MSRKLPEILAPAGNMEMCRAAVHNGADAIYIGMPGFNARGRAKTFGITEVREIINYCHLYGVRVLIAFNVLIFENEWERVIPLTREIISLRPDAFIVQDIGLVRLIRFLAPDQIVHASTQMTVTSSEAISLLSDLEITRFVLGREVSYSEMTAIRSQTDKELEVFVHGALCVSYSGQCLTSESMGGRSANRGQCAQSCRLPYELIVDGKKREMGDKRYLVSPKDLCGLDDAERLAAAGIDSFKIEGRLKSPEYVAITVKSYRNALYGVSSENGFSREQMEVVYSRGFFNGWIDGVNHQKLVGADYSSHHGLLAGSLLEKRDHSVIVSSSEVLKKGDGVMFADFSSETKHGGKIYDCTRVGEDGTRWELSFANSFPLSSLQPGMKLFLNSSPALETRLAGSYNARQNLKTIPVTATLTGRPGAKLVLELKDPDGNLVRVLSESVLEGAKSAPLTPAETEPVIAALGGTCFHLAAFNYDVSDNVFLHSREIKKLRQSGAELLSQARMSRPEISIKERGETLEFIKNRGNREASSPVRTEPALNVLIRERSQLEALEGLPVDTVYLDYEFGKEYHESVKWLKSRGFRSGIATTRIHKPGENPHLKLIERLSPDCVLVRNPGALYYFRNSSLPLRGDFSLNVANSLSAAWFLSKKLVSLCPSYDLNREQLLELVRSCDPRLFEITVHQYMPAFHMEHCVFAAFLSSGSSYRDCGRPCEKHRVELRDPGGSIHPLKADAECRNTMFNGVPQSAARLIPGLRSAGVVNFRLEALYETPEELRRKITIYLAALRAEAYDDHVFRELNTVERYGVSEGQLLNIGRYRDRKKE